MKAGQVALSTCGVAGDLSLPKGAYQFRFFVSGTGPWIMQLGLDDEL